MAFKFFSKGENCTVNQKKERYILAVGELLLSGGKLPAYSLDILCVLTFILLSYFGAKKGGIQCVLGFVSTLTALILAFVFADEVASFLNQVFDFSDFLSEKMETVLSKIKGFDVDISAVGMEKALGAVNLPSFIKEFLVDQFGNETLAEGTTLATVAGSSIAGIIVKLCAGVLVFAGVKIFLSMLGKILTGITRKIAVASAINTMLGALFGAFKAFVIVCGVLAIASLIPSEKVVAFFNDSLFVCYLYHDNPLMKLILA